jgi:hypothetical protein
MRGDLASLRLRRAFRRVLHQAPVAADLHFKILLLAEGDAGSKPCVEDEFLQIDGNNASDVEMWCGNVDRPEVDAALQNGRNG